MKRSHQDPKGNRPHSNHLHPQRYIREQADLHKVSRRFTSIHEKDKWWTPLRSGLVRDRSGKHYKSVKKAIWLYLYLLIAANWLTGKSFLRIGTIARDTSFSRRSIHRWLGILRHRGYIKTKSNGKSLDISIEKWQPISRK